MAIEYTTSNSSRKLDSQRRYYLFVNHFEYVTPFEINGYLEIRSDIHIEPKHLWQTLLEENNIKLIQEWIEYSYSNETTSSANESLFSIKLDQEMIEMISNSKVMSSDKRNVLLNKLAE